MKMLNRKMKTKTSGTAKPAATSATETSSPSTVTAVRRSLLLCALPILGSVISIVTAVFEVGANDLGGLVAGASILLLAGLLLHASLRTPGKRAPWDRYAGTVVRYRKRQR